MASVGPYCQADRQGCGRREVLRCRFSMRPKRRGINCGPGNITGTRKEESFADVECQASNGRELCIVKAGQAER